MRAKARAAPGLARLTAGHRHWWTVLSFGIALAILVVGVGKAGITWSTTARTLAHTSPALYALAFTVYYLAFPIRAYR